MSEEQLFRDQRMSEFSLYNDDREPEGEEKRECEGTGDLGFIGEHGVEMTKVMALVLALATEVERPKVRTIGERKGRGGTYLARSRGTELERNGVPEGWHCQIIFSEGQMLHCHE
jgi:hypothetical protein